MILQLEGLTVRFGGVEALAGVDLHVARGQALGLVGPNGCGKTTLFNAVSGVVRPAAGRVVFRGEDITAAPIHAIARHGIARTNQTVRLFPTMTVADNVARVDEPGTPGSFDHALEQTGLWARRHALAGDLSLAEQRRLEIARALARSPQVVLMDEPTSGLGPQDTDAMVRLLADTVLPNRSVILIEHKADVLVALCPMAVLLDQGRNVKICPPARLFETGA